MILGNSVSGFFVFNIPSSCTIAARILREVGAAEARYLVMGAFEHGPLIEWLVGRVTKEIMAKTDVPLLLMH